LISRSASSNVDPRQILHQCDKFGKSVRIKQKQKPKQQIGYNCNNMITVRTKDSNMETCMRELNEHHAVLNRS